MYHASIVKCPGCERALEVRMFGLYSLLGPSTVRCSKCGRDVDTERFEWPEMPPFARWMFLGVSLVHVALFGLIGGNVLDAAWQISQRVPKVETLRLGAPSFRYAALGCAVAAALIQAYRVATSIVRARTGRRPHRWTFWFGLQMNVQFKCLAAVILVWAAAKVIYSGRP